MKNNKNVINYIKLKDDNPDKGTETVLLKTKLIYYYVER